MQFSFLFRLCDVLIRPNKSSSVVRIKEELLLELNHCNSFLAKDSKMAVNLSMINRICFSTVDTVSIFHDLQSEKLFSGGVSNFRGSRVAGNCRGSRVNCRASRVNCRGSQVNCRGSLVNCRG